MRINHTRTFAAFVFSLSLTLLVAPGARAQFAFRTLTSFSGKTGVASGTAPESKLVLGPDGYFYGTTLLGGKYDLGTIFKVSANGTFLTLHSFNADDPSPQAG